MRVIYPNKTYNTNVKLTLFDSVEGDEIHLELFQDVFEYIIRGEKPADLEYLFQGLSYFGHETLL